MERGSVETRRRRPRSGRTCTGLLTLALVGVLAPAALAKDLCVQVDTGGFAGSEIVLKNVKPGKRQFGLVNGYFAFYSGGGFQEFLPTYGQAIVSSTGNLAASLSVGFAEVLGNGEVFALSGTYPINLACDAGPDHKIGVLDGCPSSFVVEGDANGHVVDCKDVKAVAPIP